MVKRFVGGITIGTTDSTTIGTNARGIFTSDSLVQSTSISTGSAAGIYGGTPTANATSATYALVAGGQSGSTNYPGGGLGGDYGAGGGGGEYGGGTITGITAGAPGVVTITIGGGGSAPEEGGGAPPEPTFLQKYWWILVAAGVTYLIFKKKKN